MKKYMNLVAIFFLCLAVSAYAKDDKKKALTVADNRIVSIDYTLFIDNNKVYETTLGRSPFTYVHGKGQLLKSLEDNLKGMRIGEKKTIIIEPKEAYGKIRKDFFIKIPVEKIPENARQAGDELTITNKDAKPVACRIEKIDNKNAVVNFNHPLAGKELKYRVQVVDIRDLRQLR